MFKKKNTVRQAKLNTNIDKLKDNAAIISGYGIQNNLTKKLKYVKP